MGGMTRLTGFLLVPVLALGLAGCGAAEQAASSAAGEAGSAAAYTALEGAATSYDGQARTYAADLQDCLQSATGDAGATDCVQASLQPLQAGWKPVDQALGALSGIAGEDCAAALGKVREAVPVISGAAQAPVTQADAEQLPTELSNELDALLAAVQEVKAACTGA